MRPWHRFVRVLPGTAICIYCETVIVEGTPAHESLQTMSCTGKPDAIHYVYTGQDTEGDTT